MDDVDAFVAEVVPLLREEVEAVHNGDIGPRLELWTRDEPVTLFGAWLSASGWPDVKAVFDRLATTFAKSLSQDLEVVAAGSSGDLGYVVARELTSARMTDGTERSYALRVTTVFRREAGAWKVVHRHGDDVPVVGP